jgi:endonuclease/exonuclease/phosphatase family metal-dependent hydrolase
MTGMSVLQREVERRKACYQECIVRRALLKRPGWEEPLYEDLKEKFQGDEFQKNRQKRKDHLNDETIELESICEARGYRVPPAKDANLVKVCDKIERYERAIASGSDPRSAAGVYGDLSVRPVHDDGDKYEGLARLEIARRHPERRRQVFDWNPQSKEPKERDSTGYWLALIQPSLDHLHLLWDTADFHANDFLRIIYLYGQMPNHIKVRHPNWRPLDQLDRDPDFSEAAEQRMLQALLEFKYWMDEEPKADICNRLIEARKKHPKEKDKKDKKDDDLKYEMTFWSENHQILFPAAEYLIGQLLPDAIFMPGRSFREGGEDPKRGDYIGRQRIERAKPRILRWLNDRLRFGFSEWNAPGYYKEHLQALFNLADFCLDDEIRTQTHMVIDLMFFDLARFTHKGHFGASAGRAYFESKNCGWEQGVCELIEILFGTHDGIHASIDPAPVMLTSSRVYRVPDAIIAIGQDAKAEFVDRSRVSLNFNEAHEYGIGFREEDDVFRWWSRGAWFCKQVINRTRELAEKYHLMYTEPFSKILPITGVFDNKTLYAYTALGTLLNPPLGVSLLGLLSIVDEEDVADLASVITEGSALTRANLYTYRNPQVMLSGVQNFRAGQYNFQSHPCQATLSMGATVWTTHPSAGANLGNLKEFLEIVGAATGAAGGGFLGAALGNFANLAVGGLLPFAPLAAGIYGGVKGFEVGKEAGGSLGEIEIIPVNHDGPNWWTGSVTLPRVVQQGSAAIIAYKPKDFQLALFGHRTHAWFPKAAFDQNADRDDWEGYDLPSRSGPFPTPMPMVDTTAKPPLIPSLTPMPSVNSNVDSGAWIFGRVGDSYVALYSGQKPEMTSTGDWANREIIAEGKRNVFILQVGSKDEFGSYINFKRRVLSARIHINGLHWAPADFQCSYDVPGGKRLELHYDEDKVRYAGFGFADNEFPRYDNPFAQVAWQQNRYVIQHKGKSLIHDIQRKQRRVAGTITELVHEADLRIYAQNMGLFPKELLGLPVTIIPLYKGTERDRVLQKLIDVLRSEKFDIAGLSEMWQESDRERIRDALGDVYRYSLQGPNEADLEWFDGGLMLLSRHKIINSNFTIYRQCVGEDRFANKGALHARIQVQGLPCPIDVFLTHTQGPEPKIGSHSDAHQAIRDQIRHLAAFIQSCRDTRIPALLMGDLNVDGINDVDGYNFLIGQLRDATDLKPVFSSAKQPSKHFEATSENEKSGVSSFNDGNDLRPVNHDSRFGNRAQRLDYFFSWPGTIFNPDYPLGDRRVVIHQSSKDRDMSDHYGIEARLATIGQQFVVASIKLSTIRVRLVRFWCLQTTSGPGDDEVEFTLRCVPDRGDEKSADSSTFEDVSEGTERLINSVQVEVDDPGEFLIVAVSGKEKDDFSADDSLGTSILRITRNELQHSSGQTIRKALPRLTGDGGEYVVEIEIKVVKSPAASGGE